MMKKQHRKLAIATVAGALLMSVRFSAFAQQAAPIPLDLSGGRPQATSFGGQELSYIAKDGSAKQATQPSLETLRGNGTRAGYMLTHGGIVPASVRVSVGARSLRSGVDYGLDYASGMLAFTEPVRRFDTVTVSYDYVKAVDGSRSLVPAAGMAMNFRGTALNFGYGVSSFNGLDFNSYGLAMTSKVGGGGSLKGLMYFSTPSASNENVQGRTDATRAANTKRDTKQASNGHLLTQELNTKVGAATVRATYQDVGRSFGGFQAMRQANSGNAEVLQQINILEKERGIRRLGFGSSIALGGSDKLGFDWDRTSDGSGDIAKQELTLNVKGLALNYRDLDIARDFTGFKNLREAAAGQWAREKGLRRTDMSLALAPGKGNSLGFGQSTLRDASGALTRQSIALGGKSFGFTYSRRSTDGSFARINDLADAEKNELALEIRRQFNPNAAVGEVTQKDRQQLAGETGIDRTRMGFNAALGKNGALAIGQFGVSDGAGSIRRNTLALTGQAFKLSYLDQSIDSSFSRLGNLSEFERSQYGNELGVRRTALDLSMALNKTSSLAYSQSAVRDDAGSMTTQSVSYAGKGVNARLNLASTDASFTRARDLAGLNDAQRKGIEAERGFRRMDFAADLAAIKGLKLTTYTYNATNAADAVSINRYRHAGEWAPGKATKINFLTEGQSAASQGVTSNGTDHTAVALDHQLGKGMKLNLLNDTVKTVAGDQRSMVTTNYAHFETDRSKANNLMAETRRVSSSSGSFENTTQVDLNMRASKAMSLRLNHLAVDRGSDPSAATNTLAMAWQLSKQVKFTGSYALTQTNNGADATARSFSLGGELIRNLNLTGSYTEAGVRGQPMRSASDISIANAKPFSFLGLSNATMAFKYTALNDKGAKVSQAVSGVLNASVGKNLLAFEYGGSLDPKHNSAVSRSVSFVSDRNEKLPIHFDVLYKARNINRGDLQLTRRYNLAFHVDKLTDITYTYNSLNEVQPGNLQPLVASSFALKRSLGAAASFALDYTTNRDLAKGTQVRKLGALFQTKMNQLSAVQVGYSVDISNLNGANTNAHTVSLNFDRRVDTNNVVALGAAYTMNRNGQTDDVRGTVEFKTRF